MEPKNILAALMVVMVWGLNFVAMKTAFVEVPPFLFLFLRLALTAFPLILFLPKPNVPLSSMLWIGLFQWTFHFSLLFTGMYIGLSGGITALIMQCHVIFTIIMTVIYFKVKPTALQMLGLAVSFSGLVLLTTHGDCSANWLGILLVIAGAFAVAVSNILYKTLPKDVNMPSMIVWSSAFAVPQAAVLSLSLEGWDAITASLTSITMPTIIAILYTVFISTMVGIVTWAKLMQSPESVKALPFTLLVPVVALTAGHYMMAEQVGWLDIIASAIIISGLLINQISSIRKAKVVVLESEEQEPMKKAA